MSPLAIAEWIEICHPDFFGVSGWSPLAIAEWIKIPKMFIQEDDLKVSASDSGVD